MDRLLAQFRSEMSGDTLVGHAAVFDQVASLPNHYEALSRSAFDNVLDQDVRALLNHDPSLLLARTTNNSLRLSTDDVGLRVEIDLPNTSYGQDVRELVSTGLITGMSFGFVPGMDTWTRAKDGRQLRTHTSVAKLLDVSPVTYPAYDGTDVALRSMDTITARPNGRSRLIAARYRGIYHKEV